MARNDAAPSTAWRALTWNPLRLLGSSWPWRSLAYLLVGLPLGMTWLVATASAFGLGLVTAPLGVGLPLLASAALSGIAFGAIERRRLGLVDPHPAPSPHRVPPAPGVWAWFSCRVREAATWRELACAPILCVLGLLDFGLAVLLLALVVGLLSAPLQSLVLPDLHQNVAWRQILQDRDIMLVIWLIGLWAAAGSAYLVTAWATLRVGLSRRLLVRPPSGELTAQIAELTRSRARIVNAYEAESRQIERDLHDGVQQRLTALIMTIGLADLELVDGPPAARALVTRAHGEAKQTLQELRDLTRGIRPSVLTDRGLGAAVAAVAERSPVPVQVDVDLPGRLLDSVESAAYFVVCEGLANVAKHSQAAQATVVVRWGRGTLTVEICDDGIGGASAGTAGGLVGLADRVSALGGVLHVSSPPGGPSVVRARIPCGS
jgi:signal transduction histidine kinase